MTRALEISDSLSLPLRAVTEKLAFLGRTGSGKTYAAQKLAEEMHAAAAQFVVLDPVGVWYGLRLARDGKAPGLPIPVLGGLHGDIPLEPGAGALIANLVVDRGVSVVLDVSQFESDADKARFARAFADRFFFRMKAAPSAVHLFLEECQEFAPQNPAREEAGMLHAFTRLVKIGRNYGIGVSLISQRPQEVNKKVLNLTELLFAFQLTGPQERKTLQGWIADKGIDEDIAGELPKLKVGAPHVWSPAWLEISRVVPIARKATFDASSTPAVGAKAATRALSPIDLETARRQVARARADHAPAGGAGPHLLPAWDDGLSPTPACKRQGPQERRRHPAQGQPGDPQGDRPPCGRREALDGCSGGAPGRLQPEELELRQCPRRAPGRRPHRGLGPSPAAHPRRRRPGRRGDRGAFLEHPRGLDKDRLSALSGYSATSSSFQNALGRLRSLELVSTVSPGVNAAHADFFA